MHALHRWGSALRLTRHSDSCRLAVRPVECSSEQQPLQHFTQNTVPRTTAVRMVSSPHLTSPHISARRHSPSAGPACHCRCQSQLARPRRPQSSVSGPWQARESGRVDDSSPFQQPSPFALRELIWTPRGRLAALSPCLGPRSSVEDLSERRVDQNKRMQLNPGATLAAVTLPLALRSLPDSSNRPDAANYWLTMTLFLPWLLEEHAGGKALVVPPRLQRCARRPCGSRIDAAPTRRPC